MSRAGGGHDVTFALPAPSLQSAPLDQAVGVTATTSFTVSRIAIRARFA